jgi:two-component system, NarL family, sensor kinase
MEHVTTSTAVVPGAAPRLRRQWPAYSAWSATTGLVGTAFVLLALNRSADVPASADAGDLWPVALFALAFSTVGVLVAVRQPRNAVGWILLADGFAWALLAFAPAYAGFALLGHHGAKAPGDAALWLQNWVWLPAVALPATFVLLLFPDGSLPSPRWRPLPWVAGTGLLLAAAGAFAPGKVENFRRDNPYALHGAAWRAVEIVAIAGVLALVAAVVASAAAVIVRFRRSRGAERQQLKWIAYAAALIAIAFPVAFALWDVLDEVAPLLQAVALMALPVCVGIAILRYRLYDIDFVVNRSLVYGGLTAILAGLYALTAVVAGLVLSNAGFWPAAAGTAVALAAAQPLRSRLQRRVNHLMYGARDDPYAAVTRLGERLQAALEPDAVLPTVLETVAQALRTRYVALEVAGEGTVAYVGERPQERLQRMPLVHQGEAVGVLVVATRAPGEEFDARDRRLLDDLARQIGAAVQAVRLTVELQRSRERLVSGREEERRRIRRDLHDGLGPSLAALALNLESARRLLWTDPAAAGTLLARLQAEAKESIADIRRLVYELRPPALDELGLVSALREEATRLGPHVTVEAPDALPALPAAVEVAAYRITLEALTNVSRHACADSCTVRLALNGDLELEVADDGRGLDPAHRDGVGLRSMRERVAELGGTFAIESPPSGGTCVRARLPVETA